MSIDTIASDLEKERETLNSDLKRIEIALGALRGKVKIQSNGSTKTKVANKSPKSSKSTKKKTLSPEEAIEKYGADSVKCPDCDFIAAAPQGLAAHRRYTH